MNSKKGKGKNRPNKPANPNPPQKTEVEQIPEKVEEPVVENIDSDLKIEERVPEIISDNVAPLEEVKTVEEPKKPKRNRGKKKKNEKDEIEESGTSTIVENVEEEAKPVLALAEEGKPEAQEEIHKAPENLTDVQSMAPSARKKKNKNKNTNVEQTAKQAEDIQKIEEPKQELPVTVSDPTVDIKCEILSKPSEEDIKPAKKKNKKKKRHDSEKSDKAEEISCTTAFQQLLGTADEKVDCTKSVPGSKVEKIPEKIPDVQTSPEQKDIKEENIHKDNKNKKKNKKDKHNVPTSDIKEIVEQPVQKEITNILSDAIPQSLLTENIEESKDIIETAPEEKFCEVQEKSKPKIAKPVDKKRKEKSNQTLKEGDLPETTQELPKTQDVGISEIKKSSEIQSKCEQIYKDKAAVESQKTVPSLLPEFADLSEVSKKRKKSPKPQQKQDVKKLDVTDMEAMFKDITASENVTKIQEESKANVLEEKSTIKETKENIMETPTDISSESEFNKEPASQPTASGANLEVKSGQKRKKSPKPMPILQITKEKQEDVRKVESRKSAEPLNDPAQELKTDQGEKNTELLCDTPLMEDIEIRSLKADDSEGSTAEIMPDVQYPRASSQQRVDDNNNTIIREVISPSDVKLGVPVFVPDTPFIQASIPLSSPELLASGISVIDVEANIVKPNEEKTDIKSKMMEVNQDMEELRLSIERSLAELTCIEKAEENVEQQYENKAEKFKSDSTIKPTSSKESKAIGEESQTTESAILMVEKKQSEALMVIPSPPPKTNKKQKHKTEDTVHPSLPVIPLPPPLPKEEVKTIITEKLESSETSIPSEVPPVPARKDNKGKGKQKKKGKQETGQVAIATETPSSSTEGQSCKENIQDSKPEDKKEQMLDKSQDNTKKQSDYDDDINKNENNSGNEGPNQNVSEFSPIESFEDAMTSSLDDVNQSFEMIARESSGSNVNPEINIIAPSEDSKSDPKDEKQKPVSPPKNLLGHPVIPVRSNRMDYKKEKNKTPNTILAKVKIKDSIEIESKKQSKESQTDNVKKLMQKKSNNESITTLNENEEFVYKYSFRKVFLPNVCHVCKKELKSLRVSCSYCHLLYYCSQKHKDEDWAQHQAFCFAVSTIVHLKGQKHIYEDAAAITGHNYRLLRMQMIVSCEKILKRKLVPWEQEALLYPRICGDVQCREWRLNKLVDCDGCGQISYCSSNPDHLPKSHQRWCKSYSLYQKLVCYQQTRGRLEPKLPSRVMSGHYQISDKINEVLAAMYEEKIDMSDVEYAALTQLATAPLTAAYCFQVYTNKMNAIYANGSFKKASFTVHVVGAELQFEADALNKWEVFFLHIRPDITELRVSLIAPDLNPSNLPLDLLGKIRLCDQCRRDKRRVKFSFQDNMTYGDYYRSDDFTTPDIVCAFNPSIQRSSVLNGKDTWPATITCILRQKVPFAITSYTLEELKRDFARIKECSDYNTISEPKYNSFASVRPDRNFISDDEIPLLFKNYCFAVVSGVF